jgi:type I restriction enzyme S subunit
MDAQTFIANFGHFANAPGGVSRLRDLVYHVAFAGELVEHSNNSAEDLAEVLASAESPTGRNRRPTMDSSTGYYPIPSHWRWVSIGLIGHDWGQTMPTSNFTYIDVSAIDNHLGVVADGAAVVSADNAPSRARKIVKKGTVIYSTVRPYLLNIAIIERDFKPAPIASTAFAILHPHEGVEAKFIYYFLRSPAFVRYVESVQSGIAYPAISDQKFYAASFPLAPTEEQKRIVAKVDELMALCNRLEAQQQERQKLFSILSQSSHDRFTTQPKPDNLDSIFDKIGNVSPNDLRKTIHLLAIQGLLVPQVKSEGTGSTSLAEISTHKANLRAGKSSRRERASVLPQPTKESFQLPSSWIWTSFGDVTISRDGERIPVSKEERYRRAKTYDYYGASGIIDNIDNYPGFPI